MKQSCKFQPSEGKVEYVLFGSSEPTSSVGDGECKILGLAGADEADVKE
jgi:hypothetical protein